MNGAQDVFVRDLEAGTIERVTLGDTGQESNGSSFASGFSGDARYLVFCSDASNLVPDDTNTGFDVFLRDQNVPAFPNLCQPGLGGTVACPCGNPASGPGRGCDNSSFTGGAILAAGGGAYLSSDSLTLFTSAEKPTALSIVLQGTSALPGGVAYGQGVRCVGGSLKRLFTKSASGGGIVAPNFAVGDPQVHARSLQLGDPLSAGATRWYMVYYRDPIVLGGCPASSTFNATQTIEVSWSF